MAIIAKLEKQIDDTRTAFKPLQAITEGLRGLSEQLVPTDRLHTVIDERLLPVAADLTNIRTTITDLAADILRIREIIADDMNQMGIKAQEFEALDRDFLTFKDGVNRQLAAMAKQLSKINRRLDRMHEATSSMENE